MQLTRRQLLASGAAAPLLRATGLAADEAPAEYSLYIGAYTHGASKGILLAHDCDCWQERPLTTSSAASELVVNSELEFGGLCPTPSITADMDSRSYPGGGLAGGMRTTKARSGRFGPTGDPGGGGVGVGGGGG